MNDYFYETGSTQPPKSRILIVFLLVLLIFIGGIITALSIMNIKLWSDTSSQKEAVSMRFSREESSTIPQFASSQPAGPGLGFTAETVSGFLRAYYRLPQGVYIPRVSPGSNADTAGVMPGDILLAVDEHTVTDTDTLNTILQHYHTRDMVTLTLYRDGQEILVALILD